MEYKILTFLVILVLLLILILLNNRRRKEYNIFPSKIRAVCVMKNGAIDGVIYLEELSDGKTKIFGKIEGFQPNSIHAIHIHESGDLTDGCDSACAHYNPFNKKHGGPHDIERHVGDLGNVYADQDGNILFEIVDSLVKLRGPYSVIGRSFIIHEDEDDLGKGGHSDSNTTGHAGKRLVCGVIGYANECK